MAFCTKCGTQLEEGVDHQCAVEEVATTLTMQKAVSTGNLQFNPKIVLNLLKNPYFSLQLTDNDFLYGIGGIVLSILGFFFWGYALKKSIIDSLVAKFNGSFGGLLGGNSVNSKAVLDNIDSMFPINSDLFWTGTLSIVILLLAVWLIGNWKGTRRVSFKRMIAVYGGAQGFPAIGFVISALVAFISLNVSFVLLTVLLLLALVNTVLVGMEAHQIGVKNRFLTISVSIALYVVVLSIVMGSTFAKYPAILTKLGNNIF